MTLRKFIKALFTPVARASPANCGERIRSGAALLVDVREPREWAGGVAENAALLPLSDLTGARTQWKPFLDAASARELVMYCAVGGRSAIAAKLLAAEGFRTANGGGLSKWKSAGWPIIKLAEPKQGDP